MGACGHQFPQLEKLQKEEGIAGRRKFNQYQRYGALTFAVIQVCTAICHGIFASWLTIVDPLLGVPGATGSGCAPLLACSRSSCWVVSLYSMLTDLQSW